MGVMDRFLNAMRLNTDDDEYIDDEFYDDMEDEYFEEEKPSFKFRKFSRNDDYVDEEPRYTREKAAPKPAAPAKITPMRSSRKSSSSNAMEVCVIKPTTVDDAREITETLLKYRTVILNLEGLDLEIGQRIIDFTSGSCYAVSGSLQKISNYIFVVTPSNVDLSGDFQNLMDAFDVSSLTTDI